MRFRRSIYPSIVFRKSKDKDREKKYLLNYRDNLPRQNKNYHFIKNRTEILVDMQHYMQNKNYHFIKNRTEILVDMRKQD